MKIQFLGAAENVTGSRFYVEHGKARILIDCGLYQERDLQARNWEEFPVNPQSIQALVLTHAHIDHCGYIPRLVKEGFRGKIYCTGPTAEIAKISLLDSAKLQEHDVEYKRRRHKREGRKGPHPLQPLYTVDDVGKVTRLFRKVRYEEEIGVAEGIRAVFYDAGHILGSAMVELHFQDDGVERTCIFSGDIGRCRRPLLADPHMFEKADAVVMEATYGNRLHEREGPAVEKLVRVINMTKERGGNVVIPSFAINRTQEILYYLSRLIDDNRIPHLMTFVDSPMAAEVTEIYEMYPDIVDEEAKEIFRKDDTLFDYPLLKMTKSAAESKAINHVKGSVIIIAGSGMCTGGRIKHHLIENITRPESTILFVGYQAAGTLGRVILERPEKVRIHGQTYPVRAVIEKINGFSAHADRDELLAWLTHIKEKPRKVFIVHSEKEAAHDFAALVKEKYIPDVVVPQYLESFEV
ncbi:MAG: MBL fold metallo-hydrolase [Candidatus Omnitrophica bacterium]|nr:MBL fold metallo-hydrolase [Candidatus Omnitrophota bacterium]